MVAFAILVWVCAAIEVLPGDGARYYACRVLPNGAVSWLRSLDPACPLDAYERVVALRTGAGVRRVRRATDLYAPLRDGNAQRVYVRTAGAGRDAWIAFPIYSISRTELIGRFLAAFLISAAGTCLAFYMVMSARAGAGLAAAALSSSFTGIIVPLFCNLNTVALDLQSVVSMCFLPAALFHFALVFPREHRIVRRSNHLPAFLYAVSFLLVAGALNSTMKIYEHWVYIDKLILFSIACGWLSIVITSGIERRSPVTPLHKRKADSALIASAAVGGMGALFLGYWPQISPAESVSLMTAMLMLCVGPLAFLSFQMGARDASDAMRALMAYLANGFVLASVFLVIAYSLQYAGNFDFPFGSPGLFWGVTFIGLVLGAPLSKKIIESREPAWCRSLDGWVEVHSERMRTIRDRRVAIQYLEQAVKRSLSPDEIWTFLKGSDDSRAWESASNVSPLPLQLVQKAKQIPVLPEMGGVVDLWVEDYWDDPVAVEMRKRGVAVFASILSDEGCQGYIFIGSPRRRALFSHAQLSRLAELCAQTAIAIQHAILLDELEGSAVALGKGRTVVQLAHDLKSPLKSIVMISSRALAGQCGKVESGEFERLEMIAREAQEILRLTVSSSIKPGGRSIDVVVSEAASTFHHLHSNRLVLRVSDELPMIAEQHALGLKRVLHNLLDNAFAACMDGETVEVYARRAEGETIIDVIDEGCGMSEDVRNRAFDWAFTTKEDGHGIGLPTCKELIESIGGRIVVENAYGGGTRARVLVPDVVR